MYPGKHAQKHPNKPAFIMANTGEMVTYTAYEARANKLARLLENQGLVLEDHYSIYMENNAYYFESCGAGERSGLYYTCINSYLTAEELAYIINNSESKILVTSDAKRKVAAEALKICPNVMMAIVVDGEGDETFTNLQDATGPFSG
ncbi:MAG: AMP-binding protein, partial [Sneathiella sp.]